MGIFMFEKFYSVPFLAAYATENYFEEAVSQVLWLHFLPQNTFHKTPVLLTLRSKINKTGVL
jgi:hypothetical protein